MFKKLLFLTLFSVSSSFAAVDCQHYPASEIATCKQIQQHTDAAQKKFKDYFSSLSDNNMQLLNNTSTQDQPEQQAPVDNKPELNAAEKKNTIHIPYD